MRKGVRSASELLGLTVRLHGISLGRPVDLFLDRGDLRAVGLDVLCGDEEHRFLPLAAATVGDEALAITSPLVLLDEAQLDFYRSRTFSLSSIRDRPVRRQDQDVGVLKELCLNEDFTLATVVVEAGGHERELPFDGSIRFAPRTRSAA